MWLQILIKLQTEYKLSQQDVTRRMDEVQDKLNKIKPGGTVSELEAQLNQLQVCQEALNNKMLNQILKCANLYTKNVVITTSLQVVLLKMKMYCAEFS